MNTNKKSGYSLWEKYEGCDCGFVVCVDEGEGERNAQLKAVLVGAKYSVSEAILRSSSKECFVVFDYKGRGTLKDDLVRVGEVYETEVSFEMCEGDFSFKEGYNCFDDTILKYSTWIKMYIDRLSKKVLGVKESA